MTDTGDRFLASCLTTLASPADDSDWLDVRRRSKALAPSTSPPRQRGWRGLAATVALITVAALAVTPAFGIGSRLLSLFTGPAAPPAIEQLFAQVDEEAPPGLAPGVRASDVHKLLEIDLSIGGSAILWVSPAASAGWCVYLQLTSEALTGGPTCNRPADRKLDETPVEWQFVGPSEAKRAPLLLWGSVAADVSSLHLRFRDGSTRPVTLVKGFFLQELSPTGPEPSLFTAHRTSGKQVLEAPIRIGRGIYPTG